MTDETLPLIDEIVSLEWDMFAAVQNAGGPTACQQQPETFDLMRRSQYLTWPVIVLCSYRDDLRTARDQGRNLMTEKYARMMERTDPERYAAIEACLPPLDEDAVRLVDEASALVMAWEAAVRERYPFIVARGRDLSTDEISRQGTSFETYLRAELSTYSPRTLRLYAQHLRTVADAGENGSRLVYEQLVRLYGYGNLDEANEAMAQEPAAR